MFFITKINTIVYLLSYICWMESDFGYRS